MAAAADDSPRPHGPPVGAGLAGVPFGEQDDGGRGRRQLEQGADELRGVGADRQDDVQRVHALGGPGQQDAAHDGSSRPVAASGDAYSQSCSRA